MKVGGTAYQGSRFQAIFAEHSWHDKEQVNSLMQEYERLSDKEQFLHDMQEKHVTICQACRMSSL